MNNQLSTFSSIPQHLYVGGNIFVKCSTTPNRFLLIGHETTITMYDLALETPVPKHFAFKFDNTDSMGHLNLDCALDYQS